MSCAVSSADYAKGAFQELKELLHAVAQLETRQLKLTGEVTHIFAGGGQEIHAALGQLFGLGLREIAPIAYDNAVFEPTREGVERLTIIDGGGGEIEAQSRPASSHCTCSLKPYHQPMPFFDFRAHSRNVRCRRARATWQTASAVESCRTMGYAPCACRLRCSIKASRARNSTL